MTRPNLLSAYCPSRKAIELLGNKWTLLVISAIVRGINRHNAMLREIDGISQKVLTETLRHLERSGLLTRTIYPTVPPMVEYTLTPLGETLYEPVKMLGMWAETYFAEIEAARQQYDEKANEPYKVE